MSEDEKLKKPYVKPSSCVAVLCQQPEFQQLIVDCGALPHIVNLLKRNRDGSSTRPLNGVLRRAADAITNLAHENSSIKVRVRYVLWSILKFFFEPSILKF